MIERTRSPWRRRSVETEPDALEAEVAHAVVAAFSCSHAASGSTTPFLANRYLLFPSSSRTVACSTHAPSVRATKSPDSSKTST